MHNTPVNRGTRIATMLLDHVFMTIIIMFFFMPAFASVFTTAFNVENPEDPNLNFLFGATGYIALFGFSLYCCKDIFNGRSLAKRILKLQAVDHKSGQVATPFQCFIRDLFCLLWPVEAIIALINPDRRLGDYIAGTRLVTYDPNLAQPKISILRILPPIIVSYGFILLLAQLIPKNIMEPVDYSPTSYNASESAQLAQLFSDSLGTYLSAECKVYDTVKQKPLKYISTVLHLKQNYLDQEQQYRQFNQKVTGLLYSRFPEGSFNGKIMYLYNDNHQFRSRTTTISITTHR
ncbi:hypothetical protein DBR32_01775 [Taibaiella sp. KBW10]|uniref:RDD family protein n=1 Tax=Taibaiella sp. KBW10 TaxID=2153357 RepID=UPI000F59D07A|nr:RDD family protein [Taibaiella sp. KBW10]RQO32360.1 hypothetical protein DBR32_01775 [Taibaiella sp. KBW10]